MFDILQWMEPAASEAFRGALRRRSYPAGQLIYLQGDVGREMYRLASGSVRLSATGSDGREVVLLRFESGDCFGEASLIDKYTRPHTAEALSDVELDVLGAEAFDAIRLEYRSFDAALLQLLSRQMRFSSNLFMDLSLNALPRRIARRILRAAETSDDSYRISAPLKLPLSQAEIAAMVGASRQTVNRILRQMQAEGLLFTEYKNLVVRDLDRLRALAANG